jgi:TolB protein
MNADGGDVRRLTEGARPNGEAWSPDGRTIAFASERSGRDQIYLVSAEGGEPRPLIDGPGVQTEPVWSPDGRRLTFVGGTRKQPAIYEVDADGTHQRLLLRDTTYIGGYSWSPGWKQLVFASGRDQRAGELYVMRGSKITRLTNNRSGDNDPVWSPGP